MTLTEFLLARIAEDEVTAREGGPWDAGFGIGWRDVGGISESLVIGTDRLLAECEAKRKLVTFWQIWEEPDRTDQWAKASRHAAAVILRQLALPYADHPDYEEAWKP